MKIWKRGCALFNIFKPPKRNADADDIIKFYREAEVPKLPRPPKFRGQVLSTVTMGLGDTLMLTDLPRAAKQAGEPYTCFSPSPHFRPVIKFNPFWQDAPNKSLLYNAPDLVRNHDCGNGHYLQRIRRVYGLLVDPIPRPCVAYNGVRYRNRVILHFEPGEHAKWQRANIHPRARMLYVETKRELERFIAEKPDFNFIQIGRRPEDITGARYMPTPQLAQMVDEIAQSSYFIGLMSGPMHMATALKLKVVVIMNFPEPDKIFLPTLKPIDQVESEWCYPQNVHLHQEGAGKQVQQATCYNLHRAFNGELFPYERAEEFGAMIE